MIKLGAHGTINDPNWRNTVSMTDNSAHKSCSIAQYSPTLLVSLYQAVLLAISPLAIQFF